MNQSNKCHRIKGCKRLFIDAFRAFKSQTQAEENTFILTHYHADHYGGLPRDKSYVGPARIHCTPVTGNLLREIHNLDEAFIVEHEYGHTWSDLDGNNITFYDANHCPGAAIVFVKTAGGQKHLHTGDMRYNDAKFKSYPLLSEAIKNRELDTLYLDTTYAKPKHCFAPQDETIECIASQVKNLLHSNENIVNEKKQSFFLPKGKVRKDVSAIAPTFLHEGSRKEGKKLRTLVLLSCYSIGKEKVLWNSAVQSNQLVYVNKTKYKMLRCIKARQDVEASSGIIDRCTLDPQKSDIHVITMGTAGSMHPYFKPNFEECALYAHKLNKGYNRVVAFLPTGWANSSKYNRENGTAKKTIQLGDIVQKSRINGNNHVMNVEVRCVAYSEHSSFDELRACVKFMKPKQIIPTVFSGNKDYEAIERRFQDLVDSQRAKQAFIDKICGSGMKRKAEDSTKGHDIQGRLKSTNRISQIKAIPATLRGTSSETFSKQSESKRNEKNCIGQTQVSKATKKKKVDDAKVAVMVSMGFDPASASVSLAEKNNDLEGAIEWLLSR